MYKRLGWTFGPRGGATVGDKGSFRMKPWVRAYRGLSIACLLLGGALLASGAGIIPVATPAVAQSAANTIVVEGNRFVAAFLGESSRQINKIAGSHKRHKRWNVGIDQRRRKFRQIDLQSF